MPAYRDEARGCAASRAEHRTGAKIYTFPRGVHDPAAPRFQLHRSYIAVTMDEDGNEFASIAGGYKDRGQFLRALGELLLKKSYESSDDR